MLRFGWLPIEGVEITNWAARLPQNTFGWRWLLVEEFWTPPSPDTQSEIWQSSWCKMEKSYDFYPTKKEQKFSKNGQNFCKSTSKFANILNEICLVSFVHFCEFCSTKISLETLYFSYLTGAVMNKYFWYNISPLLRP